MDATEALERLTAAVPNATTQQEVDGILQEIEQSLQNISNVIQGQRAASGTPVGQVGQLGQGSLPDNTPISIVVANGVRETMPLNVLKQQLQSKASQLRRNNPNADNKYQRALDLINQATTVEEINNARMGITFKTTQNGIAVSGGRRTKKNNKQKGGFIYKRTSTRRSILTTPKSARRSRRSSR
jgi:hypothetical protein